MNAPESDYFPRGGRIKPPNETTVKRKSEDNLFKINEQPKAKKAKKIKTAPKPEAVSENLWMSSLKIRGTLSYNKLQEGMTVLGCIRHVTNLALQIEFPGLTFGQVTINCISDAFTESLTENLKASNIEDPSSLVKNLFQLGDFVVCKVLNVSNTEIKGYDVTLSINPKDIYAEKNHSNFEKGATIWASVTQELDHGYQLSVGVKNCRIFMPFKNVDSSEKIPIGKPIFCVVHKADTSESATTLTVSAKKEHLEKIQISENSSLPNIIPGTKVEFCVQQIAQHGIKGTFITNCFGYIDETQIFGKVNLKKVHEDQLLQAYVLFTEPMTNVSYLCLRGLENVPAPSFEVGQIMSAEVSSTFTKGLFLKLNKGDVGFVTNKRLLKTLPKNADTDIVDAVKKKYPLGSKHSCRILDYNRMQQVYICTFEASVIKEKVFSVKDIEIGQKVTVKIDKIVPSGLMVSVGRVQGFIPNFHLTNSKYTEAVKSKYVVGATASARVLAITNTQNIIFTLKKGLVECEKCLVDTKQFDPKVMYAGFVVQTKISGALVAFFGDATGWITNRELNVGNEEKYVDPRDYFFRGQIVNVRVLGVKDGKLLLSQTPYDGKKKRKRTKKATASETTESSIEPSSKKLKKEILSKPKKQQKDTAEKPEDPVIHYVLNPKKLAALKPQNSAGESEESGVDEDISEPEEDSSESDEELDIQESDDSQKTQSKIIEIPAPEKPKTVPVLSGVQSFFNAAENKSEDLDSSSDDDEDVSETKTKKKKLSPAERAEMAKKEEERISKIEKELADPSHVPESAEQFDRLLLGNPNSSEMWLKYIAMHVASTELDKARAVAKRALDTINMTLVQEKFNIWVALLNLENMFGTKESFDKVFQDAVKYNDSLDIYLTVIKTLAGAGKLQEMEEKIKKIRFKEKQSTKMWVTIGEVYYTLGKYKEARNFKEAALKSILENKRQFDLILKFAIMEFQSGDLEHAIANFETILNTYPSKINIWVIYVDQLVKKKKIEEARKVLERAINQKFPIKTMKTVVQKFIWFEEQFGTPENIREIKEKAKEYVKSVSNHRTKFNGK